MSEALHNAEESLKAFLTEAQSDRYNSKNANLYKYNNLRIFMDPRKSQKPHFIIRIGISESMYSIQTGEKMSGGLGTDERYVRRWIERNMQRMDLENSWKDANKVEQFVVDYKDLK